MENAIFLTKEGFEQLQKKLTHLKSNMRLEIAHKIEVARSYGDISENSEYDAAREEESQLEQEIQEIEYTLRNAQIINKSKVDNSKVGIGSTVVVLDMKYDEEVTFKIMGTFESDPTTGSISNVSPIGKALIGAKKGDIVEVSTPMSTMKYQIKSIK